MVDHGAVQTRLAGLPDVHCPEQQLVEDVQGCPSPSPRQPPGLGPGAGAVQTRSEGFPPVHWPEQQLVEDVQGAPSFSPKQLVVVAALVGEGVG